MWQRHSVGIVIYLILLTGRALDNGEEPHATSMQLTNRTEYVLHRMRTMKMFHRIMHHS